MIEIAGAGEQDRDVEVGGQRPVPAALPVLPLRETIPLPDTLIPLAVGQERSVRLVDDVLRGDRMLVMVASRNSEVEVPGPDDLFEVGAEKRVARLRSPVTFHAAARAMRPPSSGKAGTRLKTKRNAFTSASQPSRARAGEGSDVTRTASRNASLPDVAIPPTTHATMIRNVTAGPAAATMNSSPGERLSRLSFAMPPKNHSSIPAISMPRRRATSAWPSSWSVSDTKNSTALATAVA